MSTVINSLSLVIDTNSPSYLYNDGSHFYYQTSTIAVAQTGVYSLRVMSAPPSEDSVLRLFSSPISPSIEDWASSQIAYNDDGDTGYLSLISNQLLVAGVNYYLEANFYNASDTGTININVIHHDELSVIANYLTTTGLISFEPIVSTYSLGTQTPITCQQITSEISLSPNFTYPSYILCQKITSEIGILPTITHQDNYMAVPSIKMRGWYIGEQSWEQLNGYLAMQMTNVSVPSGGLWIELIYLSNLYTGSKKAGAKLSENGLFYFINPFNLYSQSNASGIALVELQGLISTHSSCYIFIPNETAQSVIYSSIKLWWGTWTEPTTNIETFGFWNRYDSSYTGDVALLPEPIIETSELYDVTGYNPYYLQGNPRKDIFYAGRGFFSYLRYDEIGKQECAYEFVAASNFARLAINFYYNVTGDLSFSLYELPSNTLIQKKSHKVYNPTTNQQHHIFYNLKTGYRYRIQMSYTKIDTQSYTYTELYSSYGETTGVSGEFSYKHNKVYKQSFDQSIISYLSEIATQLQIKSLYPTPVVEFLTDFISSKILVGATSTIDFESEINTFKDTVTIPTLADDVSSKFSKAFIDKVLANEPMLNLFNGGSIEFYTGNRPASANHAITGQFLGAIHNLSFDTPVTDNRIQKNSAQQWVFKGENTGVIGWFRIKLNSVDTDYGMDSLTNIRIDGEAGIDAISSDLTIKEGNACRLKNFAVTWSNN